MKEQIYVVRQRVAEGGGMKATVGSGCLAEGFLWWFVLLLSGFITLLSLGEPHSQWEWAREAVRGCGPSTPATSDKINIRIRAQFLAPASRRFSSPFALSHPLSLVINPSLLCHRLPLLCFSPCLPVFLFPSLPPWVLPDMAVIMGQ